MKRFRRNSRTAFRQYEQEALIITPDDRKIHRLNVTGTFIWNALASGAMNLDTLQRQISDRFEADLKTVQEDTEEFIEKLLRLGILEEETA